MENGFHSRSLGASRDTVPDAPGAIRPLPRMQRRIRAHNGTKLDLLKVRFVELVAFLRARGGKRLMKDLIIGGSGLFVLYFGWLWLTLPDISDPQSLIASQSSVIVDRNGTELYRLFSEEDRTFIPEADIPEYMKQAIVAIEDERFYDRGCIDWQAMGRMVVSLGQGGGASTTTRQLARNALDLKRENIINRKIKEVILGCQLESAYSKDELLNLYLNWIPFGQSAYGIEQASRAYFGIGAKELTLPQAAALAALPQRPSYFSPYGSHVRTTVRDGAMEDIIAGRATEISDIADEDIIIGLLGGRVGTGSTTIYIGGRTDQVLKNMETLEYITEAERLQALEDLETIEFNAFREDIRAPHFVLWVKQQVEEMLAGGAEEGILDQGGLTIETTLDWDMQQAAEAAIAKDHKSRGEVYMAHNVALVSVARGTNEIVAYVGNGDYNDEEFDGKVDMARAPRQPGSSFKPFVYGAAFEQGFNPATVLFDVPTKIGEDTPQNFDGQFWGLMNIRRALGSSRNIPAAKAYFLAGEEDNVLEFVSRLGIVSPLEQKRELSEQNGAPFEYGWPLALGAGETPLLEMVQAYATVANDGVYKPLVSIRSIKDRGGNIIAVGNDGGDGVRAIDPRIAYQLTSVLSDVGARPNEFWQSVLSVPGFATAAKTGTSNKCLERGDNGDCTDRKPLDMWTMGYTPEIVTGIWMGNADSAPLSAKAESLSLASPVWKDYMVRAHKLLENPVTQFTVPSGIVQPQISTLSGQLPTECTPVAYRKSDVFLQENAPTEADPACVRLLVDRVTGLLASDECPAEATEMRSFFLPKSLLPDRFPQWDAAVQTWAANQKPSYDPVTGTYSGSSLPFPMAPTEKCTLALTPGRLEKPELSILFPQNGGSATHPSFQPQLDIDVGSRIREIRVTLDGKAAGTFSSAADVVIQVPRSVSVSGTHELEVTLVDEYYNTATDSVRFDFREDISDPEVRFTSPSGDRTMISGEDLVLEAEAEDDEGGIKYVQFYLNERLLSTKPKAPYELTYPLDIRPGDYTIRAVATDFAGNEGEDEIELTVTE